MSKLTTSLGEPCLRPMTKMKALVPSTREARNKGFDLRARREDASFATNRRNGIPPHGASRGSSSGARAHRTNVIEHRSPRSLLCHGSRQERTVVVDVRAIAPLAERINHRAKLGDARDEGARGPLCATETVLDMTGPTDRRGIIASGIEIQASVVSTGGKHEDDNQQGEHEGAGAEIGGSTTKDEEER